MIDGFRAISYHIMRVNAVLALLGCLDLVQPTCAVRIISSNDDGWAEVNIRALYDTLTTDGHSVVVSAPAENESGTGQFQTRVSTLLALAD